MQSCYVDTSALLKRFLQELGAAEFDAFIADFEGELVLSPLGLTEFASALQRRVRMREVTTDYAQAAYSRLMGEISVGAWTIEPFAATIFLQATQTIQAGDMSLATLDALHLMTAVQLAKRTGSWQIATSDKQLGAAAKQLNFTVHYF